MLVMINLAALGSIKNWPTIAELGLSSISYIVIASICFFIPLSLIAAALATHYSERGGIFIWVKSAFGQRLGFLAAWLFWSQNLIWYPTVFSFIAGTLAYIFDPGLESSKTFTISVILFFLWSITLFNL